jgi:Ca2+-binding RTX toxin-like protein
LARGQWGVLQMAIGPEAAQAVVDLAAALTSLGLDTPIGSTPSIETLVVRTDATWQVSADGQSWTRATPYSAFYRHAGIWDATPGEWSEALIFRTTFVVPGKALAVRAEGGSDDDLLSFAINGSLIFGEHTGYSDLLLRNEAIAPGIILAGPNTVLAHARNVGGHSSFGAEIAIDFVPAPVLAAALEAARDGDGLIVEGRIASDLMVGSARADFMSGGGGDDFLRGLSGSDTLLGGRGDDWIRGGLGDDLLDGGRGNDRIFATLDAGTGGWGGRDTLIGGIGDDQMVGGSGDDLVAGGEGRDLLVGGRGIDTLDGGSGNDRVSGGSGDDVMRLGAGNDLVFYDDSRLHDFGRGDDSISGEEGDDRLHGGRGDDAIDGGVGDDVVNGGAGADFLKGGLGADTFEFRGAYGVDRIADFAEGDCLAIGDGINGLGLVTAEMLLARITDGENGARLDLGGANAVILEGLSVEAARTLLPMAFELI